MENKDRKLLWDLNIKTDRVIEAKRPDIVLINKENQEIFITDVAIPGDYLVRSVEAENEYWYSEDLHWKYLDYRIKMLERFLKVIGALGALELLILIEVMTTKSVSRQQTAEVESTDTLTKVLFTPAETY